MNPTAFLLSLGVAIAAPLIVLHYLVPALRRASATADACEAGSSLDFWLAALRWLALLGTVMLVLSFGEFREGTDLLTVLRRTLWLVAAGLFVSVAVMSRAVWHTLEARERQRQQERLLRASVPATMRSPAPTPTHRAQEA